MTPELDWDEYGSIHRPKVYTHPDGWQRDINYVDLREFDGCHVVPIGLPCNLHTYSTNGSEVLVEAFAVKSRKFKSVYDIHCYLVRPGIHYVLYAQYHDAVIFMRYHTVPRWCEDDPTMENPLYTGALVERMSVSDRLTGGLIDRSRFPHTCPRCRGPAYIGLNDIDCPRGCL